MVAGWTCTFSPVSRRWGIAIVPLVSAVALFVRRIDRVQTGPDAGVFAGLVRNLRSSGSLTSLTDQYWIRLSPAETVARLGDIPVPDFGPLYPISVAIVPAPLEVAFLAVHIAALVVAVGAVGLVTHRATGSVGAAIAAQVIALWGPFTPDLFFFEGRPLDLFGMIGSDGPAVAWWLLGFALVTGALGRITPDAVPRWTGAAVVATLGAAMLTRYAIAGAVVGLLGGLLWARWRAPTRDHRWWLVALSLPIPVAWQLLIYPLLVEGAGPKGLALHRGTIAPIGTTIAGWFGFGVHTRTAGTVVVVVTVVALAAVALATRPGGVPSLAAAAAVGHIVVLIAARQLLDAGLNLREERHMLLVRFLLAVLVVCGVREAVGRAVAALGASRQRVAVAASAPVLAVLVVLAAQGWPGPLQLKPERVQLAVGPWLAEHGDLPVLSNNSDDWYLHTGIPAADLPRGAEATTTAPRNVDVEIAELALAAPSGRVVQAYRLPFFPATDLRDVPCAVVEDVWTDFPEVLDGFELAVIDLRDCVPA